MKNLSWQKKGDAYYLASPSEELVKLQWEPDNRIVFWMNDEVFEVKRSGFWNQRYTVNKKNQEVVSVAHNYWGSKGIIKFSDGTQYISDYKPALTLRFLDGESEILSFHFEKENGKRKTIFNLGLALVDAEKVLLLATLGMVMFLNLFNEFNEDGDDAGVNLLMTVAS